MHDKVGKDTIQMVSFSNEEISEKVCFISVWAKYSQDTGGRTSQINQIPIGSRILIGSDGR